MTPDLVALASAVTLLPGWEWWPGMLAQTSTGRSMRLVQAEDIAPWLTTTGEVRAYPDLTDPATGGVLLDLLGPGWMVDAQVEGSPYVVYRRVTDRSWLGEHWLGVTLAEACCRAAVVLRRWPGARRAEEDP